ncbi:hypothetical protein DYB32_000648 [Aphanomyces invadans]|uniref:Methyltransferase small domain-containing protein n=1 Tax=Aphanomyces invadans TaxID=157072 RepID=A0A3R6VHS4_9STRA|nr:hypothetical protein DYB32_000648 [Aphanomyces invadans]
MAHNVVAEENAERKCEWRVTVDGVVLTQNFFGAAVNATGGALWDSSLVLWESLQCRRWHGQHVLELGSGVGFLAVKLAIQGAQVVATDGDADAMHLLRDNLKRNQVASDFLEGLQQHFDIVSKPTLLLDGLKQALRSGDLWHFAFFFGWLSLVFSFTGGAIPSIIRRTATDMAAADVYTNFLFPTMSNSTFLFAPFIGYCIERFGFQQVFAGCLFLTQLFLATLLVPVVEVQLLGFVFCSIAQASLYTLQFAYIMMCYPSQLYGTLQAFVTLFSFAIGSLTYLLNPLAQQYFDGDYTAILLFLAFPTLCLYGFQHYIREEADEHNEAEAVVSSPCFPTRLPTAVASEFDSVADEALQTLRVKPASKSVVAASFAASRDPTGQTPSTRTVPSSTGTTSSLVAKIRKQAKELSELHEELAAKEKIIQKLQQSRLHGGAAGATGQHKGKEIEEWKSKYLKEQKKYESSLKKLQEMKAVLDAKEQDKQRLVEHFKQFEDALHDLREARCRTKVT